MTADLTLIHTSDWHIGHELHGHCREAEHDAFLAWLLDRLDAEHADVLLVAGDVYDVANPPVAAMQRLFTFLRKACARRPGLQVVIVGGNHDSAGRVDLPQALLGEGRVRLVGALPRRDGAVDLERLLVPLTGSGGEVAAWLAAVPYCRAGDLGGGTLATLYDEVLEHGSARAAGLPLVVSGHLHVAGGAVSEMSERRITIGGEEAQAASLFDERAAYVALGHLHRAQSISGPVPIRYSGSPFPLSATERDYRHSISVVRFAGGKVEVRDEPIPRPAAFIAVPAAGPAPLAEVEAALRALACDPESSEALRPFVEISVLVEGPEPHLQSRVLAALEGKPVRLTRIVRVAKALPGGSGPAGTGQELSQLSPDAVFAELHESVHGGAPADDLVRAFAGLLIACHEAEDC